ncbi:hypothetical protein OHT93_10405 [Streptomyces sp. NBC_00191]
MGALRRASRKGNARAVSRSGSRVLPHHVICFNGHMASYQHTATGRTDLEPFWPTRQHHDFDRVCCRAVNARAL